MVVGVFKIKNLSIKKSRKAFTLVELIIAIAILGVLSAIALPRLSGFQEKAKIKADESSLDLLNKMTDLYAVTNNIDDKDIFEGSSTDEERIVVLRDQGFLDKLVKAQQKDKKFTWKEDSWMWALDDWDESSGDWVLSEEEAEKRGFSFSAGSIYDYKGSGGDIVIPHEIGGLAVSKIGNDAFKDKGLTSVLIPDSVKEIGRGAFQNNKLESVILPDSLKIIKQGTFDNNKLKTLKIPDGVGTLEYAAFRNNQLISVELSDSLGTIGDYAFANNKIKEISLPNSVKVLGRNAFSKNQLEEITIPKTVRDIWQEVFIKNKITSINIQGKPEKFYKCIFNNNGPNGDKDIVIEAKDCPVSYKMDSSGAWIKE